MISNDSRRFTVFRSNPVPSAIQPSPIGFFHQLTGLWSGDTPPVAFATQAADVTTWLFHSSLEAGADEQFLAQTRWMKSRQSGRSERALSDWEAGALSGISAAQPRIPMLLDKRVVRQVRIGPADPVDLGQLPRT